MSRKIFVLNDDIITPLTESPFSEEADLQALLARCPDLLVGNQIHESDPRRWLLVDREVGVPDEDGASDRWSLDHLFLDHEGVPTLVEVKRSSDARLRREVIGQMLDYAANGFAYWSPERLRARFESRCEVDGLDPVEEVLALTQAEGGEVETFWEAVKTNLLAGRLRLIFVADRIPRELLRVLEFLNEQMDPAEVLAVEIRNYEARGLRTLVPTVLGSTIAAKDRKSTSPSKTASPPWTEERLIAALQEGRAPAELDAARALLDWAHDRMPDFWFGRGGPKWGSCFPGVTIGSTRHLAFAIWTYGAVEIQLQHMKPPFGQPERQLELVGRLNAIPGIEIPEERLGKRPSVPLAALVDESRRRQFLEVWEWYLAEIEKDLQEGRA